VTSVGVQVEACVVCGGELEPAFRKDGFDLVSCTTCRLLMRRRLPAREELATIYAPEYFEYHAEDAVDGYAHYIGDAERHREAARRRLRLIERFAPSRGRLLDVGAAAGFFVDEAGRRGWAAEGVDVAEHMVEWGRAALGVQLRVGEVSDVEGHGTYGAVTMWDYIEHSLDPVADLEKANELLAAGGIVALSTGDLDSLAARLSRSRWHLLTPRHHNFFFSARTLGRLLAKAGFRVLWVGHPGKRYSLAHLAYKAAPAALARRVAHARIARYSLPVNLFDIVTVVARRV
jgi:2-polyprenyl-3-methyl-5-hydroxy-6-metoxy-1,4-benzoquinol methylase